MSPGYLFLLLGVLSAAHGIYWSRFHMGKEFIRQYRAKRKEQRARWERMKGFREE